MRTFVLASDCPVVRSQLHRLTADHPTPTPMSPRRKRKAAANRPGRNAAHAPAAKPRRVNLLYPVVAVLLLGTALGIWAWIRGSQSPDRTGQAPVVQVQPEDSGGQPARAEEAATRDPAPVPPTTDRSAPSTAQPPAKMPQTVRELVLMRQHYDETVWAQEQLAQQYEQTIIGLWDALNQQSDKYQVLRQVPFDTLILGAELSSRETDNQIVIRESRGQSEISAAEWPQKLAAFQDAGYNIVQSHWEHEEFDPPTNDQPARSTVAMELHVEQPTTAQRCIITGHLKIDWATAPQSSAPVPGTRDQGRFIPARPGRIDATDIQILQRQGEPAFAVQTVKEFDKDETGIRSPSTVHPVILHDLNQDGLPEIVVGGHNVVYWNEGQWNFRSAPLCEHPARHPNAGIFADFTGDGVTDYLCGVKNGFPQLFAGQPGGKFPAPGKVLEFTAERLRAPIAITAGDIDGDRDLDVFIGQQKPGYQSGDIPTPYYDAKDSFPCYLLTNDGAGNFRDVTAESGIGDKSLRRNFCATFVDLDEDGDLDLILTSDFSGMDLFANDGHGRFTDISDTLQPRGYAFGMSHTFGDYNLDGQLDFVLIGMSSAAARRLDYLRLGRNEFPDYNDARREMSYGNRMYLRSGTGFVQAPFNASVARTGWTWGATTLDFDNDGDPDLYVTNGQVSGKTTQDYYTRFWCHDVYYKQGQRPDKVVAEFFGRMAPLFSGRGISWGGFEHNGLLMNLSGQDFLSAAFLMGVSYQFDARCTVSGDLDGDGRIDLIAEQQDHLSNQSRLHFARNQWPELHHWIGVHLRPRGVSPSPLGARVRLNLPDGRTLLQHNLSGHAAWVQHDNTVHFGLGESTAVDRIEVRWPDGSVSEVPQPAIDAYHVVSPPAGHNDPR